MSEENGATDAPEAKLRRFLCSRDVKLACPTCGSDDWIVDEVPDGEPAIPYYQRFQNNAYLLGIVALYVMTCVNCAQVRLFDRKRVDQKS